MLEKEFKSPRDHEAHTWSNYPTRGYKVLEKCLKESPRDHEAHTCSNYPTLGYNI